MGSFNNIAKNEKGSLLGGSIFYLMCPQILKPSL